MRDIAGKFWDVPDHGRWFLGQFLVFCWFLCPNFGTFAGFCVPLGFMCPNFGVGVPILGFDNQRLNQAFRLPLPVFVQQAGCQNNGSLVKAAGSNWIACVYLHTGSVEVGPQ